MSTVKSRGLSYLEGGWATGIEPGRAGPEGLPGRNTCQAEPEPEEDGVRGPPCCVCCRAVA